METIPTAMTIAGSDSGGGAGIQADLKTFAALGVYGTSAITAVTAQNTSRVIEIQEISPEMVVAQVDAIVTDIRVDAVKIGMLASSAIIDSVVQSIRKHNLRPLVVDPVMVAKGGDRLIHEDAMDLLRRQLLPLATVVTPNGPEAEVLTGRTIGSVSEVRTAAKFIWDMGVKWVVIKGGHLEGAAVDILYDGSDFYEFSSERIETRNTHGTGCTFASAITAGLAFGLEIPEAVRRAKQYVTEAIRRATFSVGHGHGPLSHFYRLWETVD